MSLLLCIFFKKGQRTFSARPIPCAPPIPRARAPAAAARARRRCPPPLPARVDMRSASDWNLTMALDLDHGLGP